MKPNRNRDLLIFAVPSVVGAVMGMLTVYVPTLERVDWFELTFIAFAVLSIAFLLLGIVVLFRSRTSLFGWLCFAVCICGVSVQWFSIAVCAGRAAWAAA